MSCCCFKLIINLSSGEEAVLFPEKTGREYDSTCVYSYEFQGKTWNIWRDLKGWKITRTLEGEPISGGDTFADAELQFSDCPVTSNFTTNWVVFPEYLETYQSITTEEICCTTEERVEAEFKAIKLPVVTTDEERGGEFKCCEVNKVLAHPTETESYKNDVTSAWIKLSDTTDTISFTLEKDGVDTGMSLPETAFPNQANAYYTTIQWKEVLNTYGIGCYQIRLQYTIGTFTGDFIWGIYDLQQYSIENALKTFRIRVKFNLNQSIEGINFTNANVEDSIRLYGFIGNRQPNMEIDNLIYNDRSVKSVVRENLNTYEIQTDPYTSETIKKLTDLYLLSENECFISDHNDFNNDYQIKDLPVIVQEGPEIDYLEKYQRKAVLTCIVADKFKNKRTFY